MKKTNRISIFLFIATIFLPLFSFAITCFIGEPDIFGISGMLRYTWVMWLFIPIEIIPIIYGTNHKTHKIIFKKNVIASIVCASLNLIFGSYRYIFSSKISYSTSICEIIEKKTGIGMPDNVKIATLFNDDYSLSYLKFRNKNSQKEFESIEVSKTYWIDNVDKNIKTLLPVEFSCELNSFELFAFYNSTTCYFNVCPISGENVCHFFAYNSTTARLAIIFDYNIIVD